MLAFIGRCLALGIELVRVDGPFLFGIENGHVRRGAGVQCAAGEVEKGRRSAAHLVDDFIQGKKARVVQVRQNDAHRRFEAAEPVGGLREFDIFMMGRVGRVIRDNDIQGAVLEALPDRVDVFLAAQGWGNAGRRIKPRQASSVRVR